MGSLLEHVVRRAIIAHLMTAKGGKTTRTRTIAAAGDMNTIETCAKASDCRGPKHPGRPYLQYCKSFSAHHLARAAQHTWPGAAAARRSIEQGRRRCFVRQQKAPPPRQEPIITRLGQMRRTAR
jgi:hypothetical protein